jgi:hypothetical protein
MSRPRRRRRPDDPAEVIGLAVSSLRLIGGIMLLFTTLSVTIALLAGIAGQSSSPEQWIRAAMYVPLALTYFLAAHFLARRHVWAAVAAIVLTILTLVGSAVVSTALIVLLVTWDFPVLTLIPAAAGVLFTGAVAVLARHLTKTFYAIRQIEPTRRQQAFELLPGAGPRV